MENLNDAQIEQLFVSEASEVLEWLNSPGSKPLKLEQYTVCDINEEDQFFYDAPIFRLAFRFKYRGSAFAAFRRTASK
jgi:hypothetical protein